MKPFQLILALLVFVASSVHAQAPVNAGLKLPAGFSAAIIADKLGNPRHLVVTPQNDIYVRLGSPSHGKGTLLLQQNNGKATVKNSFDNTGGTGIFLRDGYLYTTTNTEVYRYRLDASSQVVEPNAPERIVKGLIERGEHETKSITMDGNGNLYVTIGAPSNSCQERDRELGSMGVAGCPLLENTGGIWQFRPDKKDQTYTDGTRYATGLRNVVGLDWNYQADKLFVMQHGRDQLNSIFPALYDDKQNAELPAECLYALDKGSNAGWPFIYYDGRQHKKMQAPEYGGDGKKEGSAEYLEPAASYPAHLAPDGLLFYTGNQFPARYKNGAFIAFHGSWNRAPEPQAGYFVVFQPFSDGKPSGPWEVFADNFAGSPSKAASGRASHRPCGLAQGPDGSLYVSDDNGGAIFKIMYEGGNGSKKTSAAKTGAIGTTTKPSASAKKKVDTDLSNPAARLKASIAQGQAVYTKTCLSCHQRDGGGVQNINPSLVHSSYVMGDKNFLTGLVLKGMSRQPIGGKNYSGVMPAFAYLTDQQIADVLTFVRNNFGNKASAVQATEVAAARAKK